MCNFFSQFKFYQSLIISVQFFFLKFYQFRFISKIYQFHLPIDKLFDFISFYYENNINSMGLEKNFTSMAANTRPFLVFYYDEAPPCQSTSFMVHVYQKSWIVGFISGYNSYFQFRTYLIEGQLHRMLINFRVHELQVMKIYMAGYDESKKYRKTQLQLLLEENFLHYHWIPINFSSYFFLYTRKRILLLVFVIVWKLNRWPHY